MLLQHLKEHQLHLDIRPGDAVVLLHDLRLDDVELAGVGPGLGCHRRALRGNPAHPGPARLWDLVESESLALLGVSAKFIDCGQEVGLRPGRRRRTCRR